MPRVRAPAVTSDRRRSRPDASRGNTSTVMKFGAQNAAFANSDPTA